MQAFIRVALFLLSTVLYAWLFNPYVFSVFTLIYLIVIVLLLFWFFPDRHKEDSDKDLLDQNN